MAYNFLPNGRGTTLGKPIKTISESVAVGSLADASKTQCVAVGRLAVASKDYATAIGGLTSATGTGSVAIGRNAKSTHDFSVAIGYGLQTTAANQMKLGTKHIEMDNITTPSTSPTGGVRFFSRLNSTSGKTELCALFPTGSAVVISTQP